MPSEARKCSCGLRRFVAVLLWLVAGLAMPARAGDHERESVPEAQAFFKLTDETRLFLNASQTTKHTADTTGRELGAYLDLTLKPLLRPSLRDADWVRNRYLWMRVGYAEIDNQNLRGGSTTEHRGVVEATGRLPLPGEFWMEGRGRADLRDIEGRSSQRYRFRLTLERELAAGSVVLVPYARAEAFYDTRFDTWNARLYQVGSEIELARQWRIEPYYARQTDTRALVDRVDRIGLILKYYH